MFILLYPVCCIKSHIAKTGLDHVPVEGSETTCFLGIPCDLVAGRFGGERLRAYTQNFL